MLREEGVVRIYDIFFDYDVLLSTDAFFRTIIQGPEFQRSMSSAEFHNLCGKYVRERETSARHRTEVAALGGVHGGRADLHVVAGRLLDRDERRRARARRATSASIDPNLDVNETASIVLDAKRGRAARAAVLICGGGSPKNFMLQTEPQIQEVLGIDEKGHDYFLQITDARPDTGGLSGATPAEAVSWGKIDPDRLPDAVVCYLDSTVALPLLTAYAHGAPHGAAAQAAVRSPRRHDGTFARGVRPSIRLLVCQRRARGVTWDCDRAPGPVGRARTFHHPQSARDRAI